MEARKEQQSLPGNKPWTVCGETSQTRKIQTPCVFVSHIPTSHIVIIASISISNSERNASGSRVDGLKIKVFMAFSFYYFVFALRRGRVQIMLGASAGLMNYKHVRWSWQNNGIQKQNQVFVGCVSFLGKLQHFSAFWHTSTLSDGRGLLNGLHRQKQTSDRLSLIVYGMFFCLNLQCNKGLFTQEQFLCSPVLVLDSFYMPY